MSSPTHDWASHEHKLFLLQVSAYLKQKDSKQIVWLEDLPRELEDKEPWEVLAQLQVRGKSTHEELVRILKNINRQDAAEKVKKLSAKSKKAALTRKDSGPSSALKLEESLELTLKNCDILVEQIKYLQLAAEKGGKTRVQEVVSEAKHYLETQVQRKLKYASRFHNSENSTAASEGISVRSNGSPSPTSSPESSLTGAESSAVPRSPTHQRTKIRDGELQQAAKRLKPALGIRDMGSTSRSARKNATSSISHKTGKQLALQPPSNGVQNRTTVNAPTTHPIQVVNTNEDEDMYTLPGPPISKLSSVKTDVQYYNLPPLMTRAENQSTDSTSLVTGSAKPVKATNKKPATTPKPSKKENSAAKRAGSSIHIPNDTVDTSTGDSGYSDSAAFRKEDTPLSSPDDPAATARAEQVSASDSTYAPLIKSEMRGPCYYKTLRSKREAISDVVYDDSQMKVT